MKILRGSPSSWESPPPEGTAVAIGVFDGVHRGHETVLADMAEQAAATGAGRVALTFDPHPLSVVDPGRAPLLLGTLDQRIGWLAASGVDIVGVLPFAEIRLMSPEAFITGVLVGGLAAKAIAVGTDFRFGHDRTGTIETLTEAGRTHGFVVDAVPLLAENDDGPLSSSRIRAHVAAGEVEEAAELLGRPYTIRGLVVPGDGRGRVIGVPTANVEYSPDVVIPRRGVYAGRVVVGGSPIAAVTNVGVRPTFEGETLTVESHLMDWEGDLYGCVVDVEVSLRLRPERKFDSVEALVVQIHADIARAREAL
ncbi:MAG: bifunctional riboflavin kinase/FAD synthetase [Acidimicrobiia bacterium]|nr:bifunctional riboflavin kinase/FAD synthetase [Acidimicrobiia bacterium]